MYLYTAQRCDAAMHAAGILSGINTGILQSAEVMAISINIYIMVIQTQDRVQGGISKLFLFLDIKRCADYMLLPRWPTILS